jgi:hypothetical protein
MSAPPVQGPGTGCAICRGFMEWPRICPQCSGEFCEACREEHDCPFQDDEDYGDLSLCETCRDPAGSCDCSCCNDRDEEEE